MLPGHQRQGGLPFSSGLRCIRDASCRCGAAEEVSDMNDQYACQGHQHLASTIRLEDVEDARSGGKRLAASMSSRRFEEPST